MVLFWVFLKQFVLQILAKLMCVHPNGSSGCCCGKESCCWQSKRHKQSSADAESKLANDINHATPEAECLTGKERDDVSQLERFCSPSNANDQQNQSQVNQDASLYAMIRDIHRSLHNLVQIKSEQDKRASHNRFICREWQDIGRVLDRFFFCLYVAIVFGSLLTLSPKPPNAKMFW